MIFTELVLENFGPYAGKNIINLRPEANNNPCPIILFGGMNGGGKTTLMDAIRLALYGPRAQCSTRNNLSYNDFLTQAVNTQTPITEKTRIELAFEHVVDDSWQEYRIVRTWTKNPKDGKDSLGILHEDWPDSALVNTWDEYIETLLPLGISNLFLFDGEQVKELAEQDSPPQSVIDAIQSLLGLELAERLSVDLDVLVTRKRKKLADASQLATLEEIEDKLTKYRQQAEESKQNLASLQTQLNRSKNKLDEAAEKFRTQGAKIAADKSKLEQEIKSLQESLANQRQEMVQLAATSLPLGLIFPLLTQAKEQAETELKQQQAKIALAILQERDQRLLVYLEELQLTLDNITKIQQFLDQEQQVINQDAESKTPPFLGVNEEELKQLINCLDHQLPLQRSQAKKYVQTLAELEVSLDEKERELSVAASPEDYQKLSDALTQAQKDYGKCQRDYDGEEQRGKQIEKLIQQTINELKKYSEEVIDRQNDEHLIKSAARVQQTLTLFKERLTLKKLNKLEGEVTECFRYLLHKSDLVHRVAIDTHTFSISLFDPQGQPVAKHRLSAGEKQLLAIAFLWGLARVSGRNLPIAIDTPLGRLDSSHRSNLVERYFPTASHQVILLSTDTEIGENEVKRLREQDAIAHEYLLKYDATQRQTTVIPNAYFW
ncbi:DNA sulfur modification protein DndD [Rippkaea orientalis PCC 8801]|uniref:Nuclease SbcCD subunit C n=1 Tax=Rippkaea orientalis (strain PCC 8801 / RF-1) TaxID=41431 RepID=B7K2L8_RIPO1|nr:DNA sulfur modification protein DndD [Rippkaea orientalis]ACK66411.1 DNA sulfur modification protein DndD [Rippkaea orientalis PCC 8801]